MEGNQKLYLILELLSNISFTLKLQLQNNFFTCISINTFNNTIVTLYLPSLAGYWKLTKSCFYGRNSSTRSVPTMKTVGATWTDPLGALTGQHQHLSTTLTPYLALDSASFLIQLSWPRSRSGQPTAMEGGQVKVQKLRAEVFICSCISVVNVGSLNHNLFHG